MHSTCKCDWWDAITLIFCTSIIVPSRRHNVAPSLLPSMVSAVVNAQVNTDTRSAAFEGQLLVQQPQQCNQAYNNSMGWSSTYSHSDPSVYRL